MNQVNNACRDCGAAGTTCCTTAQERLETCNFLGNLVRRQSDHITKLQREIAEAYQVIADIRRKEAV